MIRHATAEDVPAMAEMGSKFHAEAHWSDLTEFDPDSLVVSLRQWLETDRVLILVAEEDGALVGMTIAILFPAYFNRNHLCGHELLWWVHPDFRKGLGKRLLKALEHEAMALGVHTWLVAANANLRPDVLERFHRMNGFAPAERTYMKRL